MLWLLRGSLLVLGGLLLVRIKCLPILLLMSTSGGREPRTSPQEDELHELSVIVISWFNIYNNPSC
jgi:hypothetical protein